MDPLWRAIRSLPVPPLESFPLKDREEWLELAVQAVEDLNKWIGPKVKEFD